MAKLAIATGNGPKTKKFAKPKVMDMAPQFAEDDLIAKKVQRAREELMAAKEAKAKGDEAEPHGGVATPPSAQTPVEKAGKVQKVVDRRVEDSVNALREVMKIPKDVEITYEYLLSELLGLAITHRNLVKSHMELVETIHRMRAGTTGTLQSGPQFWN